MNQAVGMLPVYSSTGKLIGYQLIYYAPNDSHDFHLNRNATVTTGLLGFVVSVVFELTGCTLCSRVSLAATGADITNQSINITEYSRFGGVYPTENPLQSSYNVSNLLSQPATPNLFSP